MNLLLRRVVPTVMLACLGGCVFDVLPDDASSASSDESGSDESGPEMRVCSVDYEIEGTVASVAVGFDGYTVLTTAFDTSVTDEALDDLDFESMDEMGLDRDDPDDQDRFRYFVGGVDLSSRYGEELAVDLVPGYVPALRRDLEIAVYDLAGADVELGTPLAVFDASAITAARAAGDLDALGELVRAAIDEMRTNGRPDVLVAFDPDRSQDMLAQAMWSTTLAQHAYYAASGTLTIDTVTSDAGEMLFSFLYPPDDIAALSLSLEAQFADGAVTLDGACLPLEVRD